MSDTKGFDLPGLAKVVSEDDSHKTLAQKVLDLEIDHSDLEEPATVREYLKLQLATLWYEGEGFSGKRPLGNSGWDEELAYALCEAGYLAGTYNEADSEWYYDREIFDDLMQSVIEAL